MIPKSKVAPISPSKFCLWPVSWPARLLADREEVVAAISRPVVLKHTTAQDEASHFLLANSFALSDGEMMCLSTCSISKCEKVRFTLFPIGAVIFQVQFLEQIKLMSIKHNVRKSMLQHLL